MTRFHGLTKLAQLQQQPKPVFTRALDAADALENTNGFTRHIGKTVRAMNPALNLFSNKGLDWWERTRDAHPVATTLASFIPVAGALPMYADAASDTRRGHYGSALANGVFGTMGLAGGGIVAQGLSRAGRAALAAKGLQGGATAVKATGWGARLMARLAGRAAPAAYAPARVPQALSRLPGVRNMTLPQVQGLERYSDAMNRLMPNKVLYPGMGVAAGGLVYDGMQTGKEQAQANNVPAGMAQAYYNLLNR